MLRVHVAPSATANGTLEVYGAPPLSVVPSEQLRLQPTSLGYEPLEQVIAEEVVKAGGENGGDGGDGGCGGGGDGGGGEGEGGGGEGEGGGSEGGGGNGGGDGGLGEGGGGEGEGGGGDGEGGLGGIGQAVWQTYFLLVAQNRSSHLPGLLGLTLTQLNCKQSWLFSQSSGWPVPQLVYDSGALDGLHTHVPSGAALVPPVHTSLPAAAVSSSAFCAADSTLANCRPAA